MKKILIGLLLFMMLSGCLGYVPGQQSYWDTRVREMCEKDGGVTIFERIKVSKPDVDRRVLPSTADGRLGVAIKELAHSNSPVYGVEKITQLHQEKNLSVSRRELSVIRRIDQVVVARQISYGRFGGDFPTGIVHDSSYGCPDPGTMAASLAELFIVQGEPK